MEVLDRELKPWLTLSPEQVDKLHHHYRLLERWNERINLTSIKPGVEMVLRHYCESLFLGVHLPSGNGTRIADIGSGAGFPGVPLAILRPEMQITLVESVRRKAVFLREATRELRNVTVLPVRAEAVRENFDWIVSRAVQSIEVLKNVPRLAPKVGLLMGEASLHVVESPLGIAWSEAVRLPWGDRRLCMLGAFHVEH